jgi:PAS domain S-box-containing protein
MAGVEPDDDDFRNFAEHLPALCWMATGDGSIFWYNRAWRDYTGAKPDEMLGWDWRAVHDPAFLPEVMQRWTEAITSGERAEMIFPLRGADGVFRPFLTRVSPLKDASGAILRWFGTSTDVSEFRAIELALRDSEARYRSAMALGRMGAWETDLSTGVRKWTPEGMALFGIDLPDGVGRVGGPTDEFRNALHPDDRHLQVQYHALTAKQDSFPAEYRIVRPDGQTRWMAGYGQVVERAPDGSARRFVNVVTDITERKEAEQHNEFLLRELSHRVKNLLTVIQAIARQSGRNAEDIASFQTAFSDRLFGLAQSTDLLTRTGWKAASLRELAVGQLGAFLNMPNARVAIDGLEFSLNGDATQSLGIAFHELTTNAVKYGALSIEAGSIALSWRIVADAGSTALRIDWNETGGPTVEPPRRQGFGHMATKQILEHSLSAKVTIDFDPSGLRWTFIAPLAAVIGAA